MPSAVTPCGAAVGILIGHAYDRAIGLFGAPWQRLRMGDEFGDAIRQSAFTMGVVVLGAKMAKADGLVTRAEIEAFKRVFRIRPDQEKQVARLFDRARKSAQGFEPYAFQLAEIFRQPSGGARGSFRAAFS